MATICNYNEKTKQFECNNNIELSNTHSYYKCYFDEDIEKFRCSKLDQLLIFRIGKDQNRNSVLLDKFQISEHIRNKYYN